MLVRITLLACLLPCLTMAASPPDYHCTVADIIGFDDDEEFQANNMQRRFMMTVRDDAVFITSLSGTFMPSQVIYDLVDRADHHLFGVATSDYSMETIVLDQQQSNDGFDATLTFQTALTANVWKLNCQ